MNTKPLSVTTTSQDARAKHSPLPWTLKVEDAIYRIFPDGEEEQHVATLNINDSHDYKNVKFICLAVNNHDQLLATLKNILCMAETSGDKMIALEAREAIERTI